MYHLIESQRPTFLSEPALRERYYRKRILILGGDGFMGVHLATALQLLGADVSVLSRRNVSLLEGTGITIFRGHLLQDEIVRDAIRGQEIIFDLAGSSGAVSSNQDARRNFVSECEPHLATFQCAASQSVPPLVVFCSSRTVYGRPKTLPVSEDHPLAPISVYAIHKLALEGYLQIFHKTAGLRYLIFRLSNPYGAYLWQEKKEYGVLNQFIQNAYHGRPIKIFGDGEQLRDFIYIDDVVEVFLRSALEAGLQQNIFNLGGPSAISLKAAVENITTEKPGAKVTFEPWPSDYRLVETGDYLTDTGRIRAALPMLRLTEFREGVSRTFRAYDQLIGGASVERPVEVTLALGHLKQQSIPPQPSFWRERRVLVTGANGFIGGRLVAKLQAMGAKVATLTRSPLASELALLDGVIPFRGDLESVQPAFDELSEFNPQIIFHMASRPDAAESGEHATRCIDVNLRGTVQLLELARSLEASFIFADSAKVYGNSPVPHRESSLVDPCSSYGASKMSAWHYCRLYAKLHGVPVVALRPTLVYGPGQKGNLFTFLAKRLGAGAKEIPLDGGQQTRDPIYIDDALCAYLRAAEVARRVYSRAIPIGGGLERTVQDLAKLFIRVSGHSAEVHCCQEQVRPTEMMRSYCDNVDAWEALRWRPEVDLEEGLRRTALYLFNKTSQTPAEFGLTRA